MWANYILFLYCACSKITLLATDAAIAPAVQRLLVVWRRARIMAVTLKFSTRPVIPRTSQPTRRHLQLLQHHRRRLTPRPLIGRFRHRERPSAVKHLWQPPALTTKFSSCLTHLQIQRLGPRGLFPALSARSITCDDGMRRRHRRRGIAHSGPSLIAASTTTTYLSASRLWRGCTVVEANYSAVDAQSRRHAHLETLKSAEHISNFYNRSKKDRWTVLQSWLNLS